MSQELAVALSESPKRDLRDGVRVAQVVKDPFANSLLDRAAGSRTRRREDNVDDLADQVRPELRGSAVVPVTGCPRKVPLTV